jgi:hypothetical protein
MSKKHSHAPGAPKVTSIQEETLDKVINYIDGPMNRRAERLLKSRWLLMPAGFAMTVGFRSYVAARDLDPRALFRSFKNDKGGAA